MVFETLVQRRSTLGGETNAGTPDRFTVTCPICLWFRSLVFMCDLIRVGHIQIRNRWPPRLDPQNVDPQSVDPRSVDPQTAEFA